MALRFGQSGTLSDRAMGRTHECASLNAVSFADRPLATDRALCSSLIISAGLTLSVA
jgi:hypothetical protein